jgi:hypothetical protein
MLHRCNLILTFENNRNIKAVIYDYGRSIICTNFNEKEKKRKKISRERKGQC